MMFDRTFVVADALDGTIVDDRSDWENGNGRSVDLGNFKGPGMENRLMAECMIIDLVRIGWASEGDLVVQELRPIVRYELINCCSTCGKR